MALYLDASYKLYTYLKRRPDRAEACFIPPFEAFINDKAKTAAELTDEEQPLIEAAKNSMSELTVIFDVPVDGAYTPDELFRLVFAPFPAQVRVRTPGTILKLNGFMAETGHSSVVPEVGQ